MGTVGPQTAHGVCVAMLGNSSKRNGRSVLDAMRARIETHLRNGALEHGDRLPSVREVAEELCADPRIVLSAYQQLVEEGLVEIRARSGVFVTGAQSPAGGGASRVPRRWLLDTMMGAIARDIPLSDLLEHIRRTLVARRPRAAVLECNHDQMFSMCEELRTYFGMNAIGVPLDSIINGALPDELHEVDLLVSASHEEIIAPLAARLCKPYVIAHPRVSLIARLSRLLASGPVYFLVTDPRFGAKMRRLIAPMPGSENFHVLVIDSDDLRVIPMGAPTYVMRSSQPHLATRPHLGRVIPPQRIFSEESSRQILARILALSEEAPATNPVGADWLT